MVAPEPHGASMTELMFFRGGVRNQPPQCFHRWCSWHLESRGKTPALNSPQADLLCMERGGELRVMNLPVSPGLLSDAGKSRPLMVMRERLQGEICDLYRDFYSSQGSNLRKRNAERWWWSLFIMKVWSYINQVYKGHTTYLCIPWRPFTWFQKAGSSNS